MSGDRIGILFDVDGTLYHQNLLRLLIAVCLAAAVVRGPVQGWRTIRILRSYRRAQEWLRSNRHAPLTRESQIEIASRSAEIPAGEIRRTVRYWMEELPLRLVGLCARRRVRRLIGRWHALGVPMGVYSDYPATEKLDRLRLAPMLSCTVCSTDEEIGTLKPDPRGFQVAAARLGLPPSRIVYVGDREDVDALGARRAGMRVVIIGRLRKPTRAGSMTIVQLDAEARDASPDQ